MASVPTRLPDGFVAFGWHSYASGGMTATARVTVAHLAPAEQGGRPWEAACGRARVGRSTVRDTPATVEGELRRGERRPCRRCFELALAQTTHQPSFERHKTGGAAYRGGATWGVVWRLGCSCGYDEHSNVAKREVKAAHREHVRNVLAHGRFEVVSGEKVTQVDNPLRLPAIFGQSVGDAELVEVARDLEVGEGFGRAVVRSDRYLEVRRVEAPWLPGEEA